MAEEKNITAKGVNWDLSHLCTVEELDEELNGIHESARQLWNKYCDKIHELNGKEFQNFIDWYRVLKDSMARVGAFAHLYWAENTTDEERGKVLSKVKSYFSDTSKYLLFFEQEWTSLSDEKVDELIYDIPDYDDFAVLYAHTLDLMRKESEYLLGEEGERVLSAKAKVSSAWGRLFDETLSRTEVEWSYGDEGWDIKYKDVMSLLSFLRSPDRNKRSLAKDKITTGLKEILNTQTFILNTILSDHHEEDKLRGKGAPNQWSFFRHLDDEVDENVVNMMVEEVRESNDICHKHYEVKANILGLDQLKDFDRTAPLNIVESKEYSWEEAKEMVIESYNEFSEKAGDIVKKFFDENWIDAEKRSGKEGGAFSHSASCSTHPYVLLNFDGSINSVYTLAHELGHGLHQYLARDVGTLHQSTPLTMAETASIFGEMLLFDKVLENCDSQDEELEVIAKKLDSTMATVYRQVGMFMFEDDIHKHYRNHGELSSDEISKFWMQRQKEVYGPSVHLSKDYEIWWSYIPHFIHAPGYVYSYAFGNLLTLSLWEEYNEKKGTDEHKDFASNFLTMLRCGSSGYPEDIVSQLGHDFTKPGFWKKGVKSINNLFKRERDLANKMEIEQ